MAQPLNDPAFVPQVFVVRFDENENANENEKNENKFQLKCKLTTKAYVHIRLCLSVPGA